MGLSRISALAFLFGLLANTEPVLAHTEFRTDAGVVSNVIALVLVMASIVIFLLIDRKKKKKDNNPQEGI